MKAYFKNAPPTRRVLEYRGPPMLENVLSWAQAVADWDGSDKLAPGWEVDNPADSKPKEAQAAAEKKEKPRGKKRRPTPAKAPGRTKDEV